MCPESEAGWMLASASVCSWVLCSLNIAPQGSVPQKSLGKAFATPQRNLGYDLPQRAPCSLGGGLGML